jgi:hypothetical protein
MALRCYRFRERSALPSLFGFAPGVVCHAVSVAGYAVRSYRTFSPLLPPRTERFVLCGTVPGVAPAGRYPAPYVDGARTFLSRSLSAGAGAAVRPTDATGMAAESRQVKPITPPRDGRKKYPEAVVLRRARSTSCQRDAPSKRGVGAMQVVLMIYQIAACRDWLRCTIYRLCTEIPRDFRFLALSE